MRDDTAVLELSPRGWWSPFFEVMADKVAGMHFQQLLCDHEECWLKGEEDDVIGKQRSFVVEKDIMRKEVEILWAKFIKGKEKEKE